MIRKYQNLKVWEKATQLVLEVYALTKAFPKDEMYGLTSQVRRAVISIPSNIAEGSERRSDKDFIRFLHMASASLAEVETQIFIAMKLNYLEERAYLELLQSSAEIGKMIHGLISGLEAKTPSTDDWRLETGD